MCSWCFHLFLCLYLIASRGFKSELEIIIDDDDDDVACCTGYQLCIYLEIVWVFQVYIYGHEFTRRKRPQIFTEKRQRRSERGKPILLLQNKQR